MAEMRLLALDGQEPLGFVASVGLLTFLGDAFPGRNARLHFQQDGVATTELDGATTIETLAAALADHLVATAAAGGALAPVQEPYGDPFPGGKEPDRAGAAEVRGRLESIGIDGGRRAEREWLRAISSDVEHARWAKAAKSPASMTLRNTCLSWRARDLARILAEELEGSPTAVVKALTASALVRCRAQDQAALASSGWDRGATAAAVRLGVAPPVAVLHEWLAIYASPCWPAEHDGVRVTAAGWYALDGGDTWFAWPLGPAAVRHLLSTDLRLTRDRGRPAIKARPHHDVHSVWAAERTVVRRGAAPQNDPHLGSPIRLRVAG